MSQLKPPRLSKRATTGTKLETPDDGPKLPFQGQLFAAQPSNVSDAFDKWQKKKDTKTRDELLTSLEPAIRNSAKKYTGNDDPVTVGQGKILVAKSLDRYDPKQSKLETYVDRQLQPLTRWDSKRKRPVKVPDRAALDLYRINEAYRQLEEETGREPDEIAIADRTGIPARRVNKLREGGGYVMPGSEVVGSEDGANTYAEDLAVQGSNFEAWAKTVRADLSEPDRVILNHTLGLDGHPVLSNKELSERLKLSPAAISQRKARIQKALDRQSELSPFFTINRYVR